jgi:hypothetical protein
MVNTVIYAQISDFSSVSFAKADSIAESLYNHSLKDLDLLSHKLTDGLHTDVEKFRAIYRWVCANIAYDYTSFARNKKQRGKITDPVALAAWNKQIRITIYRNLLDHRKTVCTGYAFLLKALANHAGLQCEIVDGYGRNSQANIRGLAQANHSWNAVRLRGKWYLCDPTWSSGVFDTRQFTFVKRYDDSYFLAAPSSFIYDHYPLDTAWMLTDDRPTPQQFVDRPLVYKAACKYQLDRITPDAFDLQVRKNERCSFSFRALQYGNDCRIELRVGQAGPAFKPKVSRSADGVFSIEHTFLSRGLQTLHVLVNGDHAFTYTVKIE